MNTVEKAKVARMVGRVKKELDNYLPERDDTLKIACEICSAMLDEITEKGVADYPPSRHHRQNIPGVNND